MTAPTRDFRVDHRRSLVDARAPWWSEVFERAFGAPVAEMRLFDSDYERQVAGIDREVVFTDGRRITVDDKVRSSDYGDILLERISNTQTGSLGWAAKALECDWFAYAIKPAKTCHLLHAGSLHAAWEWYEVEWRRNYPEKRSDNGSYVTLNVAVPTAVVLSALGRDAMTVRWT